MTSRPSATHHSVARPRSINDSLNIPFYIYAPDFRNNSGGVRVLHYLCHILNEMGEEAYVIHAQKVSPRLRTPQLTLSKLREHFLAGKHPVTIYPEVIANNPFSTPLIVRWLLNIPGHLGKPIEFEPNDLIFYYEKWCVPPGMDGTPLFIHPVDDTVFHNRNNPDDQQRTYECVYANKYYKLGQPIRPEHQNLLSLGQEISRTPQEIAQILRKSKVLYCYEQSGIISEAQACGCPVLFVRSEYWALPPGDTHHNIPGAAVYGEKDALARALDSLPRIREVHAQARDNSWVMIQQLAEIVYQSRDRIVSAPKHDLNPIQQLWALDVDAREAEADTLIERYTLTGVSFPDLQARPATATPGLSPTTQYNLFRTRTTIQEVDGQHLAEKMATWGRLPTFNFVVEVHLGEDALLADTLDSLASQWYPHWHLTIVADFSASNPELLEIPQITWVHSAPEQFTEALHHQLTHIPTDWVCLLEVGCTLEPQTLICVGNAIHDHRQVGLIYCDEDKATEGHLRKDPYFRPDFNLELLRSTYYLGPCLFVPRQKLLELGPPGYVGQAGFYEVALRFAEALPSDALLHLEQTLVHLPAVGLRGLNPAQEQQVVTEHLQRRGMTATVTEGVSTGTQCIKYAVTGTPTVSIIIPSHNQPGYLSHCLESLLAETRYPYFELVLVLHRTDDADALTFVQELQGRPELQGRLTVLTNHDPFNYAALCNQGAQAAHGEYLLFLDNDTEFIQPTWLEVLLGFAQHPKVAAVSPRLSRPDNKLSLVNQGPRILGMAPLAGSMMPPDTNLMSPGYFGNYQVSQEVSALSGSCLLIDKAIFQQLGGFDSVNTPVHEPVLELCLRLRLAGYKLLWTPWADVVHHARITRSAMATDRMSTTQQELSVVTEQDWILQNYLPQIANDPFYHRRLSLQQPYAIEDQIIINWDRESRALPKILGTPMTAACGQYRMMAPFAVLNDQGLAHCASIYPAGQNNIRLITPIELARANPDAYMVQIAITDVQIYQLKRYREFNKDLFLTYSLDDIMGNLPKKHYNYNFQIREGKTRLRQSLALVDRLIVSTEPIADFCQGMIDDIVLVPNRLEGKRWLGLTSQRGTSKKPRVGWAGAMQHLGDLELIKEVVAETADEVDWVFMGMCPDFLKPYIAEEHCFVAFDDYPAKLASLNLDLAIAPLEDNIFNEGKSNLRLLEYGIMGWPVVCSDVYPYRTNHAPVKRVKNEAATWIEALRERIHNLDAAYAEGDRLREWVLQHYILEDHSQEWLKALIR